MHVLVSVKIIQDDNDTDDSIRGKARDFAAMYSADPISALTLVSNLDSVSWGTPGYEVSPYERCKRI